MGEENFREKILLKFDTLRQFAEIAGTSESQVSRWLKKPSKKFYALLRKHDVINDSGEMVKNESEIENKTEVIKELKNIVYEKNSLIEELKDLLSRKDKIIDQYEKIIEALRDRAEQP